MSLRAGCRWVQAVGLTPPPTTHRTTPPRSTATMGPRSLNLAATPSSCRFGCQCAILGFGRCVFREQVMSHWDCSSAWTRGNPGNSGCRSWRTAGLAGVWWVHSSAGVGLLWYVCLNVLLTCCEKIIGKRCILDVPPHQCKALCCPCLFLMSTTSSSAVIYSFLALHQSHSGLGNPRRPSKVLSFLCKLPNAKAIPMTTWGRDSKSLNIKCFWQGRFFFLIDIIFLPLFCEGN